MSACRLHGWMCFSSAREWSVTLRIWKYPISHQSCLFYLPVCFHVMLHSSCSYVWAVCCLQYLPFHYPFPFFLLLFWIKLKLNLILPTGLRFLVTTSRSSGSVTGDSCLLHPWSPILHRNTVMAKGFTLCHNSYFFWFFFPRSICTYTHCYSFLLSDYILRSYHLSFLLNNLSDAEFHIMGADELFY